MYSVFHGPILWGFKNKYFLNLIIICSDSFILPVFVRSGFCNKNNHKLVILLAWTAEASYSSGGWKFNSRCQQICYLVSSPSYYVVERARELFGVSFVSALSPLMRAPPSWSHVILLLTTQRLHPLISHWELGFQHVSWGAGRDTNIQSITLPFEVGGKKVWLLTAKEIFLVFLIQAYEIWEVLSVWT